MARQSGIKKAVNTVLESPAVGWGVVGVVVLGGIVVLRKGSNLVTSVKAGVNAVVDRGDIKKNNPGTSNQDYAAAYKIAENVAKALNTTKGLSWWQTLDEDEKTAAHWLNQITTQSQANLVKQIYQNLTGYGLYYHIDRYFDFIQIKWVNANVLNWIM